MEHLTKEKMLTLLNAGEGRIYEEIEKFGAYFSSKFGISPSTALSVILGCVCLIIFVKHHLTSKKTTGVFQRSISLAELSGDRAWRRWDDYRAAQAIPGALDGNVGVLKATLENELPDWKQLQNLVGKLEMAGKEAEGVKILDDAIKTKYKAKSHHCYELEMLLVELLIYQGNYEQAWASTECLRHQEIELDARRPLFKAIIQGLQGDWTESEKSWNEFLETREAIVTNVGKKRLQARKMGGKMICFEDFKERVQHLRNKITKP